MQDKLPKCDHFAKLNHSWESPLCLRGLQALWTLINRIESWPVEQHQWLSRSSENTSDSSELVKPCCSAATSASDLDIDLTKTRLLSSFSPLLSHLEQHLQHDDEPARYCLETCLLQGTGTVPEIGQILMQLFCMTISPLRLRGSKLRLRSISSSQELPFGWDSHLWMTFRGET